MASKYDIAKLDRQIHKLSAEKKVEILWDIIALHKDVGEITTEDMFFFRRIAFKLNIDKSLIDLMLH